MSGESRAARAGRALAALLPDTAALAGLGLMSYGAALIYAPAGYLVPGAALFVLGVAGALRRGG